MEKLNIRSIKSINGVDYRDLGDNLKSYYDASSQPEVYLVKGDVKVTFAQGGEQVRPVQDNADTQVAMKGDVIIQNPSDEGAYIFRYGKGTVQERVDKFNNAYQADPNQPGVYLDKGCRPAKLATENITGTASYGGPTSTLEGGYMVRDGEGVYTISSTSVSDYRLATIEEIAARLPEAQVLEISEGVFATVNSTLNK